MEILKKAKANSRKYLMNFFISGFVSQTETAMKKANPKHTYGNIVSLAFIIGKDEKIVQRLTWTNYKGDSTLTLEEQKKFEKLLSIDVHKEMIGENSEKKKCRSIFAVVEVAEKQIRYQWNFEDGTNREIIF